MSFTKIDTEITILGGGPAGYIAALRAAQLGATVVLIEEKELGGVCLNRGCIPTKTFLKTSETIHLIKKAREFGVQCNISQVNWEVAYKRKNRVVKNLTMGVNHLLKDENITVIKGKGTVESSNEISVTTEEGKVFVNSEKMIITSGAEKLLPSIKGMNLNGVITSDEALELKEIPKSIVIIGAGAIGLEFATMFSSVGSKVTVIELKSRILPEWGEKVSQALIKIMKRQGISFKLGSSVQEIKQMEEGLEVICDTKDKGNYIQCEKVLVAVGRKLNGDSEEVKKLGLDIEKGAILVNKKMETSQKGVYAAGDVVGGKLLAHLAYAEGKVAAENALGYDSKVNYDAVPSCVYTNPEVASVGINEEEAINRGIDINIGEFYFRNNGRALSLGEREGFVRIFVDKNTGIILGGEIFGTNASEMISEITLAITLKAKAEVIADMIHPHPTLSEAIWEACADAIGRPIHKA